MCMCGCVHVCMSGCVHVCMSGCVHVCMSVCVHVYECYVCTREHNYCLNLEYLGQKGLRAHTKA